MMKDVTFSERDTDEIKKFIVSSWMHRDKLHYNDVPSLLFWKFFMDKEAGVAQSV